MATSGSELNWWQRRNWWKISFIILFVIFEITREFAVVSSLEKPRLLVFKSIDKYPNHITAVGRWRRADGGDPLIPTISEIDCNRVSQTCRVVDVTVHDNYVSVPVVSEYPAQISDQEATFSSANGCVKYDVSINAETERATNTRRILPPSEQNSGIACHLVLEDRIDMILTDGAGAAWGDFELPENNFLPIFRLIRWINENEP